MLDIAPAVDFAKHRPEVAVGGVQPILQRTHGAAGEGCCAPHRNGAVDTRLTEQDEVDPESRKVDLLGIEADQHGATEPGGGEQQQGSIAQAGEIAGTGARHADELGGRQRLCPPTCGGVAYLPQQCCHRWVGCRQGEPALTMLGRDGGGAPGQRAGAEPLGERCEVARHGGCASRQRRGTEAAQATNAAQSLA